MVVRMRRNRSKTKKGRSHHALDTVALSVCSHCGARHRPHHMCLECGYYNGKQIMDLNAEKTAREARIKAKQDRIKADVGVPAPDIEETTEKMSTEDTAKEATEENAQTKRPEKKPE